MLYEKRDLITRVSEIEEDLLAVKTTFLACYFISLKNLNILTDTDFCLRFQEFVEIDKRFYLSIQEFKNQVSTVTDDEFLDCQLDLENEIAYLEEIYHLMSEITILFQDYVELLSFQPEVYWNRIYERNGLEYEDYLNCIEGNFEMIKTLKEKEDYFE